jgi:predicted transcriptional regulator
MSGAGNGLADAWGVDPVRMHLPGPTVDGRAGTQYDSGMTRERSLFDTNDPDAEAAADARAEADVAEGRLIGHAAVRRWLASWGSSARKPRPQPGD